MGYVPAPDEWSLPPGTLIRPLNQDDLAARVGDKDVLGMMLMIDHASCYGGYTLAECEISRRAHDRMIVPGGQAHPYGDTRTGAGEFASSLRMAIRAIEHLPRVRQES